MMNLKDLLENIYDDQLKDEMANLEISSICSDSRKVKQNSLFVALSGYIHNGADFVSEAIEKGACVVAVQKGTPITHNNGICFLEVQEPGHFLRDVIKQFYVEPSQNVRAIGITGTNGKTTIAYIVEAILKEAGKSSGVIGTVNYRMGEKVFPSTNTTPALIDNHRFMFNLAHEGIDYCVMEVSSHALDQGRVDLIDFKVAAFTNLTTDHLDYHENMTKYFGVKSLLFKNLSHEATAVINIDDSYGRKLVSTTEAKVLTYGIERDADIVANDIQLSMTGTQFKLVSPEGEAIIRTKLVGAYNVYNVLAAIGICLAEEISIEKIKLGIEHLQSVPGRLEVVECGQDFTVIVDYAHTDDALANVLEAIRKTTDAKIMLVFGCGGDRDKSKRAAMGRVASQMVDFSFVTSDNPRSEEPQSIIDQILEGFDSDQYEAIVDREEAIKKALSIAKTGDIVLIAGKGHENYQEFKDATFKFDEKQIIRQSLIC